MALFQLRISLAPIVVAGRKRDNPNQQNSWAALLPDTTAISPLFLRYIIVTSSLFLRYTIEEVTLNERYTNVERTLKWGRMCGVSGTDFGCFLGAFEGRFWGAIGGRRRADWRLFKTC